jgi:NarL family two-component system response regulator LiaR
VTLSPIRVVIADDHEVVRAGMRMILADASATPGERPIDVVGEAATGDEAVRVCADMNPDVILMDLQMPGTNGIEATKAIRERGTSCAVLILTTFGDDAHVRAAIQAGAIGYLLKDILKEDLVRAIRAAAAGTPTLDPRAQHHLMRQFAEPPAPSPFADLTPRELDVLRLIARGASNKEIAATLFLSVGTVKGYVSALLPKIGVSDRTQAALFASRNGLE